MRAPRDAARRRSPRDGCRNLAPHECAREPRGSSGGGKGNGPQPPNIEELLRRSQDRLRGLLRERGFAQDAVEAVVAPAPDRLDDIVERLDAVKAFAALPEAESLAAANKRITNILKKNEGAVGEVQAALLAEAAEQRLYGAMTDTRTAVDKAFASGDFAATLKALAALRDDVDAFFNDVMVMAEDAALRTNRLALLGALHAMMNRVADISKLAA